MRLATCLIDGRERVALAHGERFLLLGEGSPDLATMLATGLDEKRMVKAAVGEIDLSTTTLLPPVPRQDKILCVGLNYAEHALESGTERPAYPSLFPRYPSSQVGHGVDIVAPALSARFDFEGELAVVVGRAAWRVPPSQALDHVAGYACFAENSVRDYQAHSRQVTAGKNFIGSGAFGPWLATADEVGDPRELALTTRLNGAVVQHTSIAAMLFPVEELIAYASSFTRLMPGDVIATGTPAGVGARRDPPLWMKPGDILEVDIPRVGLLRNRIVAESHVEEDQ